MNSFERGIPKDAETKARHVPASQVNWTASDYNYEQQEKTSSGQKRSTAHSWQRAQRLAPQVHVVEPMDIGNEPEYLAYTSLPQLEGSRVQNTARDLKRSHGKRTYGLAYGMVKNVSVSYGTPT